MDEPQMSPQSVEQVPDKSRWRHHFCTVTPLSKALAMLLFITLPFIGFWVGMEYGKTTLVLPPDYLGQDVPNDTPLNPSNPSVQLPVGDSTNALDALLIRLSGSHIDFFGKPQDYSFEWSSYPDNNQTAIPTITKIAGREIHTMELSFQDRDEEYGSYVYRLDAEVKDLFEFSEFFVPAVANDSDHPTNGSSAVGYENATLGIACLRTIENTGSEFLRYQIACGYKEGALTNASDTVRGDSYEELSVSYYPREIVGPVGDSPYGVLSWGTWAGIIKEVIPRNGLTLLAVDKVGLYKNGGSCRPMVGGFCTVNEVEDLQLLEISPDAYLTLQWECADFENEPTYSPPRIKEDGLGVQTNCSIPFDVGRDVARGYFWFDFDEQGRVIDLVQQYFP